MLYHVFSSRLVPMIVMRYTTLIGPKIPNKLALICKKVTLNSRRRSLIYKLRDKTSQNNRNLQHIQGYRISLHLLKDLHPKGTDKRKIRKWQYI